MNPPKPAIITDPDRDYRIEVRFGDAVLEAGHTSIPNLVLNHYAGLGVAPGELVFFLVCLQFKWTNRDPFPSLGTVAGRMGIGRRQARRYAQGLRDKGLLQVSARVSPGQGQLSNTYDFGPFIHAVVELQGRGGGAPRTELSEGGGTDLTDRKEDKGQEDAIASSSSRTLLDARVSVPFKAADSPEGQQTAAVPIPVRKSGGSASIAEIIAKRTKPTDGITIGGRAVHLPDKSGYLEAGIIEISEAIGDVGDLRANVARARRLMTVYGLDESSFMVCAMRAHALLKDRARTGRRPVRRPGAYFYSIVTGILDEVRQRHRDSARVASRDSVDVQLDEERAS